MEINDFDVILSNDYSGGLIIALPVGLKSCLNEGSNALVYLRWSDEGDTFTLTVNTTDMILNGLELHKELIDKLDDHLLTFGEEMLPIYKA
ncbi:hypothetical protein [Neptuniibacter sp. QD37_11]|uniref:hypothetical protein n=1 Tax=Neptuniibacter sp. QD37_11 TaxID=3398209 RepID=UPI0039F4DD2F